MRRSRNCQLTLQECRNGLDFNRFANTEIKNIQNVIIDNSKCFI